MTGPKKYAIFGKYGTQTGFLKLRSTFRTQTISSIISDGTGFGVIL